MINRINLILRAKNISARQFAEEIGIQPSGMSHIMSGRNNPSLDFVTKVIRRYPEIDANWLLMGRGAMYGGAPTAEPLQMQPEQSVQPDEPRESTLFSEVDEPQQEPLPKAEPRPYSAVDDERARQQGMTAAEPSGYRPTYIAVPPAEEPQPSDDGGRCLECLLFVYSDGTFREYKPQR